MQDQKGCTSFCREKLDGFEIEHCKRQGPSSMPLYHYHDSYEIYYLLSGIRNYFIKDRIYTVKKGDMVLIGRHDLHKTTYGGSQTHERILINFDQAFMDRILPFVNDIDLLEPFRQDMNVITLPRNEQVAVEQLLFKIMKEAREAAAGYESCVRFSLAELLINIARKKNHSDTEPDALPNQMHEKISEIVRHINGNYMEKLSLNLIAEAFYISPYYLSRLFKKETGFTFVEYLNSIRIRQAQQLLLETRLNVGEIAQKTGYDSSTHFGRVFKEVTGMSPLRFRNINRKQAARLL